MITYIGLCITPVSLIMIGYALVEHLEHNTMPGWTSILVSLWFIGGVIITGIGVIGLYIGKIYRGETSPLLFHRRTSESVVHLVD